jgi:hypothetical protein
MRVGWDRLTTEMIYDTALWNKVGNLFEEEGLEITREVLKLRIKF